MLSQRFKNLLRTKRARAKRRTDKSNHAAGKTLSKPKRRLEQTHSEIE